MPPWAGEAFGPDAGIVAVRVNVHYDNPLQVEGVVDSSGMKFFYTTTPRKHVVTSIRPMMVSSNDAIVMPPGRKRWFFTRTCEAEIVKKGTDETTELRVLAVNYHAHLLGREMYTEIQQTMGSTVPMSLGSESKWHFDDQGWTNVYNAGVTIRTGDVIQSTCVMDTSSRTTATVMGVETTDEMCWARIMGWSPDGHEVDARCKGHMWSGELLDMEIPFGLAKRHPYTHAPGAWDASNPLTAGTQVIKDGKKFCGDNSLCVHVKNMLKTADQCTFDLGVLHSALAGSNVMEFCCKSVCETNNGEKGMCSDHQTCKNALGENEGIANDRLPVASSEQTYKLRVPACSHEADGFMNLELNVDGMGTTTKADTATDTATPTATAAETAASNAIAAHPMFAAFLMMSLIASS